MTIIEEIDSDTPLNIDDKCDVKWRAGDKTLQAVIIERRPKNDRKRRAVNKKDRTVLSVDNLKADEVEYYVHYVDHDRCVHDFTAVNLANIIILSQYL